MISPTASGRWKMPPVGLKLGDATLYIDFWFKWTMDNQNYVRLHWKPFDTVCRSAEDCKGLGQCCLANGKWHVNVCWDSIFWCFLSAPICKSLPLPYCKQKLRAPRAPNTIASRHQWQVPSREHKLTRHQASVVKAQSYPRTPRTQAKPLLTVFWVKSGQQINPVKIPNSRIYSCFLPCASYRAILSDN